MGKHDKKSKRGSYFILVILVIIIIIAISILYTKMKTEALADIENQNIDETIVITYMNKDNIKNIIKDYQAINEHITMTSNKGIIYIKEENDKNYKKYNEQALEEGKYIVISKTKDGISNKKEIIIDTKSPTISNIADKRTYKVGQTITITDDNGIASVNLKLINGTLVPVEFEEKTKSINYTFEQKGTYTLAVEDIAGNRTRSIAFIIEE